MASQSIGNSGIQNVANFTIEDQSSSPKEFYLEYAGKKYKITMNNIAGSDVDETKQKVAQVAAAYIAAFSVNTPDFEKLVIDSKGATDPNKTNNSTCKHEQSLTSFESLYRQNKSQNYIDSFKNSRWGDDLSSLDKKVFEDSDDSVNSDLALSQKVQNLVTNIFTPPVTDTSARLPALHALPAQATTKPNTNTHTHTSRNVVPVDTDVSPAATSTQFAPVNKLKQPKDSGEDDASEISYRGSPTYTSLGSEINADPEIQVEEDSNSTKDADSDSDEELVEDDNKACEYQVTSFANLIINPVEDSNSNNGISSDGKDEEACVNEANNDGDNFEEFSITKVEDEEGNKESQTMMDKIKSGAINLASSLFSVVAGTAASIAPGNQYIETNQ